MSSTNIHSPKHFSELNLFCKPIKIDSFLEDKYNALSSLDFLEGRDTDLPNDMTVNVTEFKSNVYLVSSNSDSSFDQSEVINKITTQHLIYDEFCEI
jgi:hypothetical protein